MTAAGIAFDPLLPWELVAALGALALLSVIWGAWRGTSGWWLRAGALALLVLALAGPQLRQEEREGLPSVAFVVADFSESTSLEDRAAQIEAATASILEQIEAAGSDTANINMELVEVETDPSDNTGTRLLSALDEAAARVAPDQVAGAVLITDGQIHDRDRLDAFPAPVHALIAGEEDGFDLRLELVSAPAFGIVGNSVTFKVKAHALGKRPADLGISVMAEVSVDGGPPQPLRLDLGSETELEVEITHGGSNIVDIQIAVREDELTDRNNRVIADVNGVRDRLRVLLVSGEPHSGGRTWRDILKSDPAVDLIHFTILRPPGKQDGTPANELSLITFPTRELFIEKIDGFDLIVFDRYRWRGILHSALLANVANYVRKGGAVFVSTGAAFAGAQSLSRTPLIDILPAEPRLDVIESPFLPRVTDLGHRHPVTAGLEEASGYVDDLPDWGRWMRQVPVEQRSGHTVMSGAEENPLLILDRVGEGRVALLASDQAWLWTRGFEGGGPQAELIRRTAHWLMKEPALEEEALMTRVDGADVIVERRSVSTEIDGTVLASPPGDGEQLELSLTETAPGRWQTILEDAEEGLWRFRHGELEAVAALGPPSPREYENPLADPAALDALIEATGGSTHWISDGVPEVRLVREGQRAYSSRWIGLEERDAYNVTGVRLLPLLPAWLAALISGLLFLAAWRREGAR
ncbi:hypothetical protein KHP62_06115 [Rhodobacteraceae bacterium NNCM2]|nr:hypothetical protein [Coraliihabitans acroporae]